MRELTCLFLTVTLLAGCGLSPTYRYDKLVTQSDFEVCYALTDPRRNTVGQGWAVKADAASKVARERDLQCDYEEFSRIHRNEVASRQLAEQKNMQMMRMGSEMMEQPSNAPIAASNGVTCFKKREWVSGMNKNCVYDCAGSEAVQTIGAAQLCPLSIRH